MGRRRTCQSRVRCPPPAGAAQCCPATGGPPPPSCARAVGLLKVSLPLGEEMTRAAAGASTAHGQVLRVDRRLLRLKKSDIECVILAWSSHAAISVGEITIGVKKKVIPGARSARFFKDFGFVAPKNPQNCLACGPHGLPMGRFLAPPEPNLCQGS